MSNPQYEDEDEAFEESASRMARDSLLIAIDMSASMLTPPTPRDDVKKGKGGHRGALLPPAVAALKCAYELMTQRIISNPKDQMGVLLFGTEKSRGIPVDDKAGSDGSTYPNCYVLVDLSIPSAADVKHLGDLIAAGEGGEDSTVTDQSLRDILTPSKASVSMSSVFLCANQLFSTRASKSTSQRLFIVTDNDKPHVGNKDAIAAATVRAKDLFDSGVMVDLFPIIPTTAPAGTTFDRSAFYNDIAYGITGEGLVAPIGMVGPATGLTAAAAQEEKSAGDGISLLQSLLESITSRAANKRAIMNATMILGPNMYISVRGFANIRRQAPARTSYVWLQGSQPLIARHQTTRIAEDTGRTIESADEILKGFRFGGSVIPFTKEELANLRRFNAEELPAPASGASQSFVRIIGFKPLSALPAWARVRPPVFLYPSEHEYSGSTRVFAALFQSLRRKKKMALAWCMLRQNGMPTLAALVPTMSETLPGSEGKTDYSASHGLYLISLPFTEDLRQVPDHITTVPPSEMLDLQAVKPLTDVIGQLHLPGSMYDPSRYPNPSLQQFYTILRALALDEDLPETAKDKTIPRYVQIDKRVGEVLRACSKLVEADARSLQMKHMKRGSSPPVEPADSKRSRKTTGTTKTISSSSTTAATGGASSQSSPDLPSDQEMLEMYKSDTLGKLTVAVLKAWVGSKDRLANAASTAKRKNDWIACVESYFAAQR